VQRIADALPVKVDKANDPLAADVMDSGMEDLAPGVRLRVVEPIFSASAGPNPRAIDEGDSVSSGANGDIITLKVSPDLVTLRTSWYELRDKLVFSKEEMTAMNPGQTAGKEPPRLSDLLPAGLRYYRLLNLVRRKQDADRGQMLMASESLPALLELSDAVRRDPRNCGNPGRGNVCLRIDMGAAVTPFVSVEVNGAEKLLAPNARLSELLENDQVPATLRVWRRYHGRLLAVDFRGTGSEIMSLPLMGGERIRF
jgi:hypothetical protein